MSTLMFDQLRHKASGRITPWLIAIVVGALVIGAIVAMGGNGPPASLAEVAEDWECARATIETPRDVVRVLDDVGVNTVRIDTNARRLAEADAELQETRERADQADATAAGIDRLSHVATLTAEEQNRARQLASAIRTDAATLRESVASAASVRLSASAANEAVRLLLKEFENAPEMKTQAERDDWTAARLRDVQHTVKDLVQPEAAAHQVEASGAVIERLESNLNAFAKEFGGEEYREELAEAGISIEDVKYMASLIAESKDTLEQTGNAVKEIAKEVYDTLRAVAELAKDIAKAVWKFLSSLFGGGGGNGPDGNGGGDVSSGGPAGDVADTEGSGRGSGGKQEASAPPKTDSKSDDPNGKPAVTTGANKGDGGGFKPGDKNLDTSGLFEARPGGPRLPQGIGAPLSHVGAGVGPEGSTSYAVYATPEVVTIVEIIDSGNASSTRQFFIRAGTPLFKALMQDGAAKPYIVNLQSVKARSDGKTEIQFSGLPRPRESDLVKGVFDTKGEMESVSGLVVQ